MKRLLPVFFLITTLSTAVLPQDSAASKKPTRSAEHEIVPPPVPEKIQVEAGFTAFFEGHAEGTQNYVCKPSSNGGFAFVLFTPQATLSNDGGKQLTTHFFSPNPFEANIDPTVVGDRAIRATWQDSRDSSTVWAKLDKASTDSNFVAPGAIAWVLLDVTGAQNGPTGGDTLTPSIFIQRVNTSGGVAPSTGCASPSDVGNEAFVHYTADYFFYEKASQ